jgi:transposase
VRTTLASLPDDIDALKRLVLERDEKLEAAYGDLLVQTTLVEYLKLQIAKLKRLQFGRSSEKLGAQIDQLELIVEDLEATQAQSAPLARLDAPPKTQPARRPLPEHLPREVVRHEPAPGCPDCGATLAQIGEDAAEMLEYVPASFKVIRHVRPRLACTCCERIVQQPAPIRPIDRGIPGPGLLAHVLVSKYADHLPLYRQAGIYARQGIELERSTLADWVGASARLLSPLIDALRDHVLSAEKLHADDTPVPVLAPGAGKTRTGRLWVYVRDDRASADASPAAVLYRYSPDRKGEHPRRQLAGWRGALQADAYSGFDALYQDRGTGPPGIVEVACWAHLWMPPLLQVCSSRRRQKPQLRSSIRPVAATRPASPALMVIREPGPNHVPRAQGSMRPTGLPRPRSARFCHHARFTLATAPPRSPRPVSRPQAARGAGTP